MISPMAEAFSHNSIAFRALVMNKISSLFTINRFYRISRQKNLVPQQINLSLKVYEKSHI